MKPVLAEILTLAGVAIRNVVCRWKYHLNQYRLQGHEPHMPAHFADVPRHLDHSLLHALNNEAQTLGLSKIFNFVTPIQPDNGEEFLATYYLSQEVRNKNGSIDKKTKLCRCDDCRPFVPFLVEGEENVNRTQQPEPAPIAAAAAAPPPPAETIAPAPSQASTLVPLLPAPAMAPRANQFSISWMPPMMPQMMPQQPPMMQPPPPPPPPMTTNFHIPFDACFSCRPYHCGAFQKYRSRKLHGEKVMGKPPHDAACPVRRQPMQSSWM